MKRLLLALLLSGCAITPYEVRVIKDLTPEQIDALARLKEATGADFYFCFSLGGPPPTGTTMIMAFPKDAPKPNLVFSANCQVTNQPGGIIVAPGSVTVAPLTLVPKP